MMNIFEEALALLHDEQQDPVVRDACASLLSVALEGGLEARLPDQAPLALFRWMISTGAGRSWLLTSSLGRIRSEVVTTEAVGTLLAGSASKEVRDVCAEILCGSGHAPRLDDDTIHNLLVQCPEEADRLVRVVEAAHSGRGIEQHVLLKLQGQLQRSEHVDTRVASVSIAMLREFDVEAFKHFLGDPHELVRAEAVRSISRRGPPGPGIRLISARVVIEPVVWVKAEMLQALGKLVQRMPE